MILIEEMKNFNIILINVHAPIVIKKDRGEKKFFYAKLEDLFNTSVGNVILILGDFNVKVGREQ